MDGGTSSNGAGEGGLRIRAVLFDAGNTLVFVDPVRVLALLAELGVQAEQARFSEAERGARLHLTRQLQSGATGTEAHLWREYFGNLLRLSGVPEDLGAEAGRRLKEAHDTAHLWSWIAEDTPSALRALSADGYRLAVVSNADGRVEALLRDGGLGEHFEFVIDSHVFGVEKPDPRIFLAAVERLGLAPAECLYVGDLYPVDVLGARGAGLQAVLVDPWDHFELDVDRVRSVAELPEWLRGRG